MSRYSLELQLQKQSAAALAAGRDNRGDREDTAAALFGAFAAADTSKAVSFEEAVLMAKAGGWPVVIHLAGEWAICDAGGTCQIRIGMLDRDDPREYWA